MIADQVGAGRWHQRREPAQQFAGLEDQHLGSRRERALQPIGEPAIGKLRETTLRQGRPGTVPAQMREALAVVGVQVHSGVEGEALEVSGLPPDPDGIGTIAPQQAQGIGLRRSEGVGSAGIGLRHLETRTKQPAQAPHDAAEHLLDLGVRGSGQSEKACRFPIADEHAVWNHAMKVHVEVEGAAESLNEGDRARPRRSCSGPPRPATLEAEDRAQGNVERARDELRVSGEKKARPTRQRQHPLAHRHVRKNAVQEVRRGPLHAARGAGRAEAAALAGKGDQHLVPAGGAAHAGKAVGENAASEVPFELRNDEPG